MTVPAPIKPGDKPSAKPTKAKDDKKQKRAAAVAARASAGSTEQHGPPKSSAPPKDTSSSAGPSSTPQSSSSMPAKKAVKVPPPPPPAQPPQNLLFSHLPSAHLPDSAQAISSGKIHPIIVRLGILISTGEIRGTNARVMGTMAAFKEVIRGFSCPVEELHRLLPAHLSPMIAFLDQCRPKGVAGGNAIRWLKSEINKIGTDKRITSEAEQKDRILNSIDEFLRDRIELADEVICSFAIEKIKPGDTVVAYARSSLVEKVILDAWRRMRSGGNDQGFSVIVADSEPLLEGKALLGVLIAEGIPCTYSLLPSLPSVLPRANLVLLGTSALLSDGALYARAGTAMVAMLAKESRIPVVACCEIYKFGEKVVLDAVTGNEMGDPNLILNQPTSTLSPALSPLHLLYDLTPPALITAVCTEVGFIPPSSVPTVITKGDGEAL